MIWINSKLRDKRKEDGFTLIELMVVVLIIAILIAIAIPTFLGARGRAQDRAAQSSLRNTVTAAKAIYTDDEDYFDATVAAMRLGEPALQIDAAATESTNPPNHISIDGGTSPSAVFRAAAKSANGTRCWYVMDRVDPVSFPGTWWAMEQAATAAAVTCEASTPPAGAVAADFCDNCATPTAGQWTRQPGDAVA